MLQTEINDRFFYTTYRSFKRCTKKNFRAAFLFKTYRSAPVGNAVPGVPVQEPPTAYKPVRPYRLPLTRSAGTCPRPTETPPMIRTPVGWGHVPTGAGTTDCPQAFVRRLPRRKRLAMTKRLPYLSLRNRCAHRLWQARAGTTNCVQACSPVPSAAYAVGGDMSPATETPPNDPHPCRVGTCPHRCRNYRLLTDVFVCTVYQTNITNPNTISKKEFSP